MLSHEDDRHDAETEAQASAGIVKIGAKKRRLQRACDICRRRKVRCDGGNMSQDKCTNCKNGNLECTYVESRVKRGPTKPPTQTLDARLGKMERMVSQALAENDHGLEPRTANATPNLPVSPGIPFLSQEDSPELCDDELSSSDEEAGAVQLSYGMQKLTVDSTLQRFFGKSSGAVFLMTAMEMKNRYVKRDESGTAPKVFGVKRPEYWSAQPWVRAKIQSAKFNYSFPENDLLWTLIDLYFKHVNPFLPLLHRPTFEDQVADECHLRDGGFGGVVSLVCALGSRFCDNDPRVLLKDASQQSAGWTWYDQVQLNRNSGLEPASIYEIQAHSLAGSYLLGCSSPQACWNIVGIGLRLIQDIGAHRKKVYQEKPTVSDELWRRAFWCLVFNDRINSVAVGRAPALNDEDFDLDMATEVDDEYWLDHDPEKAFKQPLGKPSTISFFNAFLKLHQIAAFALRTIYSINRSKVLLGYIGPQWQQNIVAQLDSALNKWVDNIPEHLRWNPNRENPLFFDQSVILYGFYYQTQILVHRPFIPKPRRPSPLSFPSLAICTNAARSCSHLVDVQRQRKSPNIYMSPMPVFTAGIVLLLNIWGATKAGIRLDQDREMADVHKCMQVLSACEARCHFAGRFCDILRDLAEAGKLPLPEKSPPGLKRARGSDIPMETPPAADVPFNRDVPRPTVTNRRVSEAGSMTNSPSPGAFPQQSFDITFPLPMHTSELGILPVHHEVQPNLVFNWSPTGTQAPQHPPAFQMQPSSSTSSKQSQKKHNWTPSNVYAGGQHTSSNNGFASSSAIPSQMPDFGSSLLGSQPQAQQPTIQFDANAAPELLDILFQQPMNMTMDTPQPTGDHGQNEEAYMNKDMLQMWSNAPTGFEWGDWCDYIENVNDTHGFGPLGAEGDIFGSMAGGSQTQAQR